MGTTLYTTLHPETTEIETNNDRVFLAELVGDYESMAALCGQLAVTSLSEFQSYDAAAMAEMIDDAGERAALIANAPAIQWFEPAEALPVVHALRKHYAGAGFIHEQGRRPAGKKKWEPVDRTQDLIGELDDLASVLDYAETSKRKFRIHVGF